MSSSSSSSSSSNNTGLGFSLVSRGLNINHYLKTLPLDVTLKSDSRARYLATYWPKIHGVKRMILVTSDPSSNKTSL